MKRSYCFFLLPILVASAGCPSTDNNVGSLGKDAGAADGSGQVASDGPSQAADMAGAGQDAGQKPPAVDGPNSASTCVTGSDCPSGLSCGYAAADGCAAKGVCMKRDLQGAVGPDYMCGCDGQAILPIVINSSTVLYVSAPYSGWAGPCTGMPDSGVPDAASAGKDAAPDAPEAGAAHQCQLNTDGTCSAVTPNTACTPFNARRYDDGAGCYATDWTTLWCCATAAGDSCGGPGMIGCLQVASAAATVTYWTPTLAGPSPQLLGAQACDQSKSATVTAAQPCSAAPADPNAEEAAIYAVLLGNTGGKLPIIEEQTSTGMNGVSDTAQTVDLATSRMTGVDPATISSFLAQNATAQSLRADMVLGYPYVLLSPTDPIYSGTGFWDKFRARYPNGLGIPESQGVGYETFSRVGFNANLDQALVYMGSEEDMVVGTYESGLGQGYYYLMKKVNGVWTIDQKTQTWTT